MPLELKTVTFSLHWAKACSRAELWSGSVFPVAQAALRTVSPSGYCQRQGCSSPDPLLSSNRRAALFPSMAALRASAWADTVRASSTPDIRVNLANQPRVSSPKGQSRAARSRSCAHFGNLEPDRFQIVMAFHSECQAAIKLVRPEGGRLQTKKIHALSTTPWAAGICSFLLRFDVERPQKYIPAPKVVSPPPTTSKNR